MLGYGEYSRDLHRPCHLTERQGRRRGRPRSRGPEADWGNAREGPAVGSSYTDDSRCELALKELGRQKGRPQRGAHTGAG